MKKLFIIPYRAREAQREVFINHMTKILEGQDYEMIFVHQCDTRTFNRGAMKNIGFLYGKKAYPGTWKDMTFIFHDIDCMPSHKNLFDYDTTKGNVSHYFGFKHVLGGIFAIKGSDFEKTYGFPNLWGWGFEDNAIEKKWKQTGGKIDRRQWQSLLSDKVVQLHHGWKSAFNKTVNPHNADYYYAEVNLHGFHTLRNVNYNIVNYKERIKMLNVNSFLSETKSDEQVYHRNVVPRPNYKPSKITRMGDLMRMGHR